MGRSNLSKKERKRNMECVYQICFFPEGLEKQKLNSFFSLVVNKAYQINNVRNSNKDIFIAIIY